MNNRIASVLIGVVDLQASGHHDRFLNPYLEGVRGAGAEPVILTWTDDPAVIESYVSSCDGFLLTGGSDIEPSYYNEERIPQCDESSPERDAFESLLIQKIDRTAKPIFGICRGFQMLNVFYGGSLWQDIPSQFCKEITHNPSDVKMIAVRTHEVTITPNTRLHSLLGCSSLQVCSMHHQGIKKLADRFVMSAIAPDGIIEAFESNDSKYILAVQWHPEWLLPEEDSRRLFSALVEACKKENSSP